jgi:hypothetical protein
MWIREGILFKAMVAKNKVDCSRVRRGGGIMFCLVEGYL